VLHYFAGFGGGRKALLPGVAGIESISKNHSMNLDPSSDRLNPDVEIGKLDGNPVAEDMLEGARSVKVHCTLNTVLNREGRIAGVFAGELDAAHRAACDFAKSLYAVPLQEQADLVIAASGPTKNYVQSHKALYNAYQAVKPEGRIVLAARCEEGLGGEQFAQWVRLGHPEAIMRALRQRAEINGQTALSTLQKTPITLMVTDLSDEDVRLLGARKAASFEAALETARKELAAKGVADPACYVMPSAAYSVPMTDADAPPA
jgi:nickel-dependent lactate racemase